MPKTRAGVTIAAAFLVAVSAFIASPLCLAQRQDLSGVEALLGKWDLTVSGSEGTYPSWLEVERSGFAALVGRFVGRIGGARPISRIVWNNGIGRFNIPTEWERPIGDLQVEVRPVGDSLIGTIVRSDKLTRNFVGRRAPSLRRTAPSEWTTPMTLFNGRDFTGWVPAPTARVLPNNWIARDGVLVNTADEGVNLMTTAKFQDFKLHVEFRLAKGATSGVFPRGRYWVILKDVADPEPSRETTGAVHRFLVPNENVGLGADVWQTIDITLIGRRIAVTINGKNVITDQIIPGITGSAIDSNEEAPGPIMLQGEEQRVEFRNLTISVPITTR